MTRLPAALLLLAVALPGCSLTPAPDVPRFHASAWCGDGTEIACDAGLAGSLAAWRWNEQATYLGLAAFVGGSSGGVGCYYSLGGTPAVALGAGWAVPYDSEAGIDFGAGGPIVGITASWGAGGGEP
jgi:hypothetical protein